MDASVRVWESSRGTAWVFARVDLYSVFVKFCEWLRGYGKRTIKHAVPDSDARAAIICIKTCVLSVCEGVGRYIQCDCVHVCLNVRVCVSASVHNISHTILLQYFYTSGRTVSCIIVSLNLGKKKPQCLSYCTVLRSRENCSKRCTTNIIKLSFFNFIIFSIF